MYINKSRQCVILLDYNDKFISNQCIDKSISQSLPGEIIMVNKKNGIAIMTNDCPILIKYGQLEGKNKTDGYTLSLQSELCIKNIIGKL